MRLCTPDRKQILGWEFEECPILGPVWFNLFMNDLDKGADASSASSVMSQSWEEWPIPQNAVSPSEGPQQRWERGTEEPSEIQKRQVKDHVPGEE